MRSLENSIKRQTKSIVSAFAERRRSIPSCSCSALHAQFGPFFSDNIYARPSLELGFGELTTLLALNFEGVYRLPVVQTISRWNVYVGGGPALNFSHGKLRSEARPTAMQIDFSDLSLDVGFNFLIGLQSRDGMFLEMKTSAYSIPTLRFEIGYNF